ncbi:MAG: nitrate ABC transporter substrate-binding protein [Pseudanabaena sp.]|nr:MAG: nitrate ABC transporter substrate-binding protein [Pseudanabaena sp.]
MLPRIALTLIAFIFVVSLSACSQLGKPTLLRVGLNDWPGYAIAIYAKEAKLFEKYGIEVDLVEFINQQDNIRATIRGAQDMSFVTLWELMQIDPSDDNPVVVLVADISAGSDGIVARPEFSSVNELRGKKVSAKLGTVAHLILLEALSKQKIPPDDVEIVNVSNERGAELLKTSDIDAAVMWEPLLSKTQEITDGKIIYTTKDIDSLVIDTLATGSKFLKNNRSNVTKFIMAWLDAIHDMEVKPDVVLEVIAQQTGQTVQSFSRGYSGLKEGDIALNKRMFEQNGRLQEALQNAKSLLRQDLRHGKVIRDNTKIDSEPLMAAIADWKP